MIITVPERTQQAMQTIADAAADSKCVEIHWRDPTSLASVRAVVEPYTYLALRDSVWLYGFSLAASAYRYFDLRRYVRLFQSNQSYTPRIPVAV